MAKSDITACTGSDFSLTLKDVFRPPLSGLFYLRRDNTKPEATMTSEKISKNIKGGARVGAGRKKGSPNKKTAELQKAVEESGITPVDFMLSIMRDENQDEFRRLQAANMAAPYVHAKLSSIEMNANVTNHEAALDELE